MSKAEQAWYAAITEHGCLVNNEDCGGGLERHHITNGGRRMGDLFTLPLCRWHHHWDSPLPIGHALHKGKKAWERNHGAQLELLASLKSKLDGVCVTQSSTWKPQNSVK